MQNLKVDELKVIMTIDTLKTVREALCFMTAGHKNSEQYQRYIKVIQRLIDDIDRQRPLGNDGKHGERHTKFCGCEDK